MENNVSDTQKGQVVFVDGANFFNSLHDAKVQRVNFKALASVLRERVGQPMPCAEPMHYTFNVSKAPGYAKSLTREGFDVIDVIPMAENDDAIIRQMIDEVDVQKVGKIILVAGDGGYLKHLQRKAEEGVEIWIVGFNSNHTHSMSTSLIESFNFFDLTEYLEELRLSEYRKTPVRELDSCSDIDPNSQDTLVMELRWEHSKSPTIQNDMFMKIGHFLGMSGLITDIETSYSGGHCIVTIRAHLSPTFPQKQRTEIITKAAIICSVKGVTSQCRIR